MNWDDDLDSHQELQDSSLWVSDASDTTQLQEDVVMLLAAKQTLAGALAAAGGQ
jgi:hypothetical protein